MDNPAMYFVPNSNAKVYSTHQSVSDRTQTHDVRSYCDACNHVNTPVFLQFGGIVCSVTHIVGH